MTRGPLAMQSWQPGGNANISTGVIATCHGRIHSGVHGIKVDDPHDIDGRLADRRNSNDYGPHHWVRVNRSVICWPNDCLHDCLAHVPRVAQRGRRG